MAAGPVLSYNQIQSLWIQNGGAPGWAPLAAAIAIAESGGKSVALNNTPATGDYSVGLWQINYFGNLANSRTASYGTPAELQADPNLQAKAAIALSGNGTNWGPWKTDAAWNAWEKAGAPAQPSAATVASWGVSLGGAGGGTAATATTANSTPNNPEGIGCARKGNIFGTGGVLGVGFTACQGKALLGGLCVGGGVGIALIGIRFVLGNSGAASSAMKLAKLAL